MIQIVFYFWDSQLKRYYIISKGISYIISWSFDIHDLNWLSIWVRLSNQIKGWTLKDHDDKLLSALYHEGNCGISKEE